MDGAVIPFFVCFCMHAHAVCIWAQIYAFFLSVYIFFFNFSLFSWVVTCNFEYAALDSDDLLYLKEQMEAEEDAERLLRRTEKRAFAAFKISFNVLL